MIVVADHVLEVIGQRIGIARAAACLVGVAGRRGAEHRRRLARIVRRDAVELVVLLAVVVDTRLDLQLQVVDDLPREARIGVPRRAVALLVRVGDRYQRVHRVARIVRHVHVGRQSRDRNRRVEDRVAQTSRRRGAHVVERVGPGTRHVRIGIADREVERHALGRFVVGLQVEVVAAVVRPGHDRLGRRGARSSPSHLNLSPPPETERLWLNCSPVRPKTWSIQSFPSIVS